MCVLCIFKKWQYDNKVAYVENEVKIRSAQTIDANESISVLFDALRRLKKCTCMTSKSVVCESNEHKDSMRTRQIAYK